MERPQSGAAGDLTTAIRILQALTRSLIGGLVVWVLFYLLSVLSYFYLRAPAGAWMLHFTGLPQETVVILTAAFLALTKLGIAGLALLCLIAWWWQRNLAQAQGQGKAG